jgi:hypothetical protein
VRIPAKLEPGELVGEHEVERLFGVMRLTTEQWPLNRCGLSRLRRQFNERAQSNQPGGRLLTLPKSRDKAIDARRRPTASIPAPTPAYWSPSKKPAVRWARTPARAR